METSPPKYMQPQNKKIIWGLKSTQKLNEVISFCGRKGKALDLGCGAGANSLFLAQKGFNVVCVDSDRAAIEYLNDRMNGDPLKERIETINEPIELFEFSKNFDLIISVSTLHFFDFKTYKLLIEKIYSALNKGGILFIRVFSDKDSELENFKNKGLSNGKNEIYSPKLKRSIHFFTEEEIRGTLNKFKIEEIEEYRKAENHPPVGDHEHWLIDIIARK